MSTNGITAGRSISNLFRINPFSVPNTIQNGLARVKNFNTSKNVPLENSLRDIATGIDRFVKLTREDPRGWLEIEPYFGAKVYDDSDTAGLVTAGCRFTFSFHGFKDKSKNEELLASLGMLEEMRDHFIQRASTIADETLGLDKLSISEDHLECELCLAFNNHLVLTNSR